MCSSDLIEKFENEELTKSIKRAEKTYKLKKNLKFEDLREVMDEEMLEDFYSKGYFKEDKENETAASRQASVLLHLMPVSYPTGRGQGHQGPQGPQPR